MRHWPECHAAWNRARTGGNVLWLAVLVGNKLLLIRRKVIEANPPGGWVKVKGQCGREDQGFAMRCWSGERRIWPVEQVATTIQTCVMSCLVHPNSIWAFPSN